MMPRARICGCWDDENGLFTICQVHTPIPANINDNRNRTWFWSKWEEICSRSCVEFTLPLLTSYNDRGITQESLLPISHHSLLLALTPTSAIFRLSIARGYSLALTRNYPGRPFTMHEGRSIYLLALSNCFRLETMG